MVARTIPKNRRTVTGRLASTKNQRSVGFESMLEKDVYTLLEFDPKVDSFEEQPVTITYHDPDGKPHRYTPDVLIRYRRDVAEALADALCEIKYRSDLREHWADYKPKFKAAHRYARQHGWRFQLVTEREVRTPLLNNARFLLRYRDPMIDVQDKGQILATLQTLSEATPRALIAACSDEHFRQAHLIQALWHLVARGQIGVELTAPLTMQSPLWSLTSEPTG